MEVHFPHWISTHTISTGTAKICPTTPLSRDPQVKGTSVCVSKCVCATVHACVTLCVGGCTCVFIKKYQLFWSVAHHSSHSPLSCTHLTRPQEKKGGKSVTDGEASEQDKDISKSRGEEEEAEEEGDVCIIKGYDNIRDFREYVVSQPSQSAPFRFMFLLKRRHTKYILHLLNISQNEILILSKKKKEQ